MSSFLSSHNRAFIAEWMKLKRTGMFWLCLGAAAFFPILGTLVTILVSTVDAPPNWDGYIRSNFSVFTGFFYPLFLVILMVRIVYLEHQSDTWKLIETQPVSKLALFISKYEVAALFALLSLISMILFSWAGGLCIQYLKTPNTLKTSHIEWVFTGSILLRYWLASLGIIAIQYFLSLLIKSFAWPMTIGLVCIVGASILLTFSIYLWFPYSAIQLTSRSYYNSRGGLTILFHEKLSILWAALFLWISYRMFVQRNLLKGLFATSKQITYTVLVAIVFIGLFVWINKPKVKSPYNKTIIAGMIKSDKPVSKVVVVRAPYFDTVMKGDVINGSFHLSPNESLVAGVYYIKAGNSNSPVFFGANDSLFIDWKNTKEDNSIKFSGTRQAENEFLSNYKDDSYSLSQYSYTYTPTSYARAIVDRWESGVSKIEKYKTVDNVKPAADFIALQKKLLAVKYLSLVDLDYPKTFSLYYPNDSLKYPPYLDNLRKQVSMNDTSLLAYSPYMEYVSGYLASKAANSNNPDSSFFKILKDSISSKQVRDLLSFGQIKAKLTYAGDSARRGMILDTYLPSVQNDLLRRQLVEQAQKLDNFKKGKKAPLFTMETVNGKEIKLQDLANRYLVVDVWATWCAPCKKEAPYFDEFAERFTGPRVAFVSLSIDEDKRAWQREAYGKSKRIVQVWAKNAEEDFQKKYDVASIPRYMLIDPKGNIINAEMPHPSDPEFESILQKEIPSLNN